MKKNKLKETVYELRDDFNSSLRTLCGRPSAVKRLVIVLIIGGALSVVSVSALVEAIYNIGKRDAELIHIEHIKQLELKRSNDSINAIKSYRDEYE
jgi:UDP-N-acetylglucosamine:LPS N-acetylglucosamine transferase